MTTRLEIQTHDAVQQIPRRLEAIETEINDLTAHLKLIEIGLDQLTTSLENVVMAIARKEAE